MVCCCFILVQSEPHRIIFFQVKMTMIALAGLNAFVFHKTVYRWVAEWDNEAVIPMRARVAGFLSLVLWSGVVVSGRMQAYNWFD